MSGQNVELVRRSQEAFDRGDMDLAFAGTHPQLEWVIAKEHPEARTLRGHEAIAEYRREWLGMLDGMRVLTDRIVDAGDSVVVVGRVTGTGVGSGAPTEVPIAFVSTFRDGEIVRVEEYLDPAEALGVAGL